MMAFGRHVREFVFTLLCIVLSTNSIAYDRKSRSVVPDSVCVKAGVLVVLKDSFYIAATDTVIATDHRFVRLRQDPMARSKAFYDSLAIRTSRGKVFSQLYRLFVRDNNPVVRTPVNDKPREKYFNQFNGKIIRSIRVIRIPVFDGNVNDTSGAGYSRLGRWMNVHPQTHTWKLKGKGLIQPGEELNGTLLSDYERLVRDIRSVRDARLYVVPKEGTDSVDLVMASQDYFPIRFNLDYRSAGEYSARLTDRNISGDGLEAGLGLKQSGEPNKVTRSIELEQSHLFNRFFDARFYWSASDQNENIAFSFNRDFQSGALTHLGGINLSSLTEKSDGFNSIRRSNTNVWYGYVFTTASYRWNFIPAFSYSDTRGNANEPNVSRNAIDQSMLWSFTWIRRSFLRSALVRKYGTSEYIPVGFSLNYTTGYATTYADIGKWYHAISMDWAHYFTDAGYVGAQLKTSRFSSGTGTSDVFALYSASYYSPLLKLGRIRFRQFADLDFGSIRYPVNSQWFTAEGPWLSPEGDVPSGDRRLHAGLHTVFFMPWHVYGFRFAVYDAMEFYSFRDGEANRHAVFPKLSAGLRLQNDFLTYGDLSMQASWYPAVKSYPAYFQITFRTFILPVFDGLNAGRPDFFH